MDKPQLDESKADEYIGKTVLLGVTYLDHQKKPIGQHQWVGTVLAFSNKEGIRISVRNSTELCALPPDPRGIRKAKPGIYKLRSTGEEVVNPDYVATWTCVKPKPEEDNLAGKITYSR